MTNKPMRRECEEASLRRQPEDPTASFCWLLEILTSSELDLKDVAFSRTATLVSSWTFMFSETFRMLRSRLATPSMIFRARRSWP